MPSYVEELEVEAVKVVSIFPDNPEAGLPTLQGMILLTETQHGRHLAAIEASGLTVLRTGAAAGVATQYLAREQANRLSILGCGAQARGQLEAVLAVRPIDQVFLWNRTREKAVAFQKEIQTQHPDWHGKVVVCDTADEAANQADILVLSSRSEEPLFNADVLRPGVHINAIGAYRPNLREFGVDTLERTDQVWVDSLEGARHEAGDLIQPAQQGLWSWDQVQGEIAELVTDQQRLHRQPQEITLYKSVGVAYMDTVAAAKVYQHLSAKEKNKSP